MLTDWGVSGRLRLQVMVSIVVGEVSSVSTMNPSPFLRTFCSAGLRLWTALL
jgi:hypothetical protein